MRVELLWSFHILGHLPSLKLLWSRGRQESDRQNVADSLSWWKVRNRALIMAFGFVRKFVLRERELSENLGFSYEKSSGEGNRNVVESWNQKTEDAQRHSIDRSDISRIIILLDRVKSPRVSLHILRVSALIVIICRMHTKFVGFENISPTPLPDRLSFPMMPAQLAVAGLCSTVTQLSWLSSSSALTILPIFGCSHLL